MDCWEEDYYDLLCEGAEFHYYADIIEICEREEQIKKILNKLINEDVNNISNYIFSFLNN